MATLEIPSNVKCITSGQVPTTTNLKDGEFAFGKVGGIAKLYGNVNGVIIDFTGDGDGIEPGTGEGAVQQVGAKANGKQAAAFGGLRYDKQTDELRRQPMAINHLLQAVLFMQRVISLQHLVKILSQGRELLLQPVVLLQV